MKRLVCWWLVFLLLLGSCLAPDGEKSSSTGVSGDTASFDASKFNWKTGDYSTITAETWSTLTDFSNVQMGKIPNDKISNIVKNPNFNRWNDLTASQIQHGNNLDSIGDKLSKLNSDILKKAIKGKFLGVDPQITIQEGTSLTSEGILTSKSGGRFVDIKSYPKNSQFTVKGNDIEIIIPSGENQKISGLPKIGGEGTVTIKVGSKTVEFPDSQKISGTLAVNKNGQIYVPTDEKAIINHIEIRAKKDVMVYFGDSGKGTSYDYLIFGKSELSGSGNGFEVILQAGNNYVDFGKKTVGAGAKTLVDDWLSLKLKGGTFILKKEENTLNLGKLEVKRAPSLTISGPITIVNDDFDIDKKENGDLETVFFNKKFTNNGDEEPRKLYDSVPLTIIDKQANKRYGVDDQLNLYEVTEGIMTEKGLVVCGASVGCTIAPMSNTRMKFTIQENNLRAYKAILEKIYGVNIKYSKLDATRTDGKFSVEFSKEDYLTERQAESSFTSQDLAAFCTSVRQNLDAYPPEMIKLFKSYDFVYAPNLAQGVENVRGFFSKEAKAVVWSGPYRIGTSSHEMFHGLDEYLKKKSLAKNWPSKEADYLRAQSARSLTGFPTEYSTARKSSTEYIPEDKAEVYRLLISNPLILKARINTDPVLKQKVEIIRLAMHKATKGKIVGRYPQFSEEYWGS